MPTAEKIVSDLREALGSGDFAAARQFLNSDFSFQGPIDTFTSPEPYLESLKKLHPIVKRIEVRKLFVDGNDVCVLYDMVTNTAAGPPSSPSGIK